MWNFLYLWICFVVFAHYSFSKGGGVWYPPCLSWMISILYCKIRLILVSRALVGQILWVFHNYICTCLLPALLQQYRFRTICERVLTIYVLSRISAVDHYNTVSNLFKFFPGWLWRMTSSKFNKMCFCFIFYNVEFTNTEWGWMRCNMDHWNRTLKYYTFEDIAGMIRYVRYHSPISICTIGISNSHVMTSSNYKVFRVTGHLCGDFTGTKATEANLCCFLWSVPE